MSTLISGRLKWILRVAISLLVISFWGAYLWRNWDGFLSYRWQLDFSWLLLDLLAAIAFWASLPLLWQRVLASMGGSLPVGSAVQLWTTSMLGRYLPGGCGTSLAGSLWPKRPVALEWWSSLAPLLNKFSLYWACSSCSSLPYPSGVPIIQT